MVAVTINAGEHGVRAMCRVLDVPRSTYYRKLRPWHGPRRWISTRSLSTDDVTRVLAALHEPRFCELAPAEVCASLLDEGIYLCSERTMYRVLARHREVRERRAQLRHPAYVAPELLATAPNQLWSWDITKLRGPTKWSYTYLYVVLDVFSRYVVGWMVADCESATRARKLFLETCEREGIAPGQLTLHADRGSSMKSKCLALTLADLGVTKTHSRPHVSNDNPSSEAHFKTLKYRPNFPSRFGSIEDARAFCKDFFDWYNLEHYHPGLALLTRTTSIIKLWRPSSRIAPPSSLRPSPPTPSASSIAPRLRRFRRPPRGSTSQLQSSLQQSLFSKFMNTLSHNRCQAPKHAKDAAARNLTRKEFLNEHNDPSHYRPEDPSFNRSHAGEDKSDTFKGSK